MGGLGVRACDLEVVVRSGVSMKTAPILVAAGRSHGLAAIPVGAVGRFRELVERIGVCVGLSSVFVDFADTRIATVEAADVLATAELSDQLWNEFEGSTLSGPTRSPPCGVADSDRRARLAGRSFVSKHHASRDVVLRSPQRPAMPSVWH